MTKPKVIVHSFYKNSYYPIRLKIKFQFVTFKRFVVFNHRQKSVLCFLVKRGGGIITTFFYRAAESIYCLNFKKDNHSKWDLVGYSGGSPGLENAVKSWGRPIRPICISVYFDTSPCFSPTSEFTGLSIEAKCKPMENARANP